MSSTFIASLLGGMGLIGFAPDSPAAAAWKSPVEGRAFGTPQAFDPHAPGRPGRNSISQKGFHLRQKNPARYAAERKRQRRIASPRSRSRSRLVYQKELGRGGYRVYRT